MRRLTETAAAETDARFSPRGRYVSFVREQNLYAIELATRREIAVTRDGAGLVSFGTDEAGHIYVVGFEGRVYRMDFTAARFDGETEPGPAVVPGR